MGHSRLGRADGRSGDVSYTPIAIEFCDAAEFRDVPITEVTRRALDAFLERAMKREVGPNTKSCTNLWGPIRVLV
jgi:hypothetical protein